MNNTQHLAKAYRVHKLNEILLRLPIWKKIRIQRFSFYFTCMYFWAFAIVNKQKKRWIKRTLYCQKTFKLTIYSIFRVFCIVITVLFVCFSFVVAAPACHSHSQWVISKRHLHLLFIFCSASKQTYRAANLICSV